MKYRFTYVLLPLIVAFAMSCGPGKSSNVTPTIPDGSYSGQFRLIHVRSSGTRDTDKANITVSISPVSTATYAVTGDTAVLHAGSKGSYTFFPNGTVKFVDKTISTVQPDTKTHLNGFYSYAYDGNIFRMVAYGALDTLIIQYDLAKSGN